MSLLDALTSQDVVIAAELRPPRAELGSQAGMDAWIDTYHAVRGLARRGLRVFLTDSAVGTQEENNLRHLVTNLGRDVPREHIVPFLTAKHSLEFCLSYAEQAWQQGFPSLVVLGGDKHLGRPRCVEHAWELRALMREREPRLTLGGWANPYADADAQVRYLVDPSFTAEYYLTQIVSHLDLAPVQQFLDATARRGVRLPGVFGVFYYRSANPRTLQTLSRFLPVPVAALTEEFERGATALDICARTMQAMMRLGVRNFYVSNLPLVGAAAMLEELRERVSLT